MDSYQSEITIDSGVGAVVDELTIEFIQIYDEDEAELCLAMNCSNG